VGVGEGGEEKEKKLGKRKLWLGFLWFA